MKLNYNVKEFMKAIGFLILILVFYWSGAYHLVSRNKKENVKQQAMAEYYFTNGEYFGELKILKFLQTKKEQSLPSDDFKLFYSDPKNKL